VHFTSKALPRKATWVLAGFHRTRRRSCELDRWNIYASICGGGCGACQEKNEESRLAALHSYGGQIVCRGPSPTNLEFGAPRHHLIKGDADALDHGQQDGAADGRVPHGLEAAADGQSAAGQEAGSDGVVRILLPADSLDGTVERA